MGIEIVPFGIYASQLQRQNSEIMIIIIVNEMKY